MLKRLLNTIIIYFCILNGISADCLDKVLYCFDSKEIRIGGIIVGQCWQWSKFSCEPCGILNINDGKQNSFHRYFHFCRYYYPNTVQVLDTKSVWAFRIRDLINYPTLKKFRKFKRII